MSAWWRITATSLLSCGNRSRTVQPSVSRTSELAPGRRPASHFVGSRSRSRVVNEPNGEWLDEIYRRFGEGDR